MIETNQLEKQALIRSIVRLQDHPLEVAKLVTNQEFVDPTDLVGKVKGQKMGSVPLGDSHNLAITLQQMTDGTERIRLRLSKMGDPIQKDGKTIRPEIEKIDHIAIVPTSGKLPHNIETSIVITSFAQYQNQQHQLGLKPNKMLADIRTNLEVIAQKDWK